MLRSKVAIGEHYGDGGSDSEVLFKQCSAVMPATTIDRRIRRQGGNPYHLTEAATKNAAAAEAPREHRGHRRRGARKSRSRSGRRTVRPGGDGRRRRRLKGSSSSGDGGGGSIDDGGGGSGRNSEYVPEQQQKQKKKRGSRSSSSSGCAAVTAAFAPTAGFSWTQAAPAWRPGALRPRLRTRRRRHAVHRARGRLGDYRRLGDKATRRQG